jgi:hypothetical protein
MTQWLPLGALYRYFVSQSSEFCRHNPLCCLSTSVYFCKRIFRYPSVRKLLDTPVFIDCNKLKIIQLGVSSSGTIFIPVFRDNGTND